MKAKQLILFVIAIICLIFIAIALQGRNGMAQVQARMNTEFEASLLHSRQVSGVQNAYLQITVAVNKANSNQLTAAELTNAVNESRSIIDKLWTGYTRTELTETMEQLAQEVNLYRKDADVAIERLKAFSEVRNGYLGRDLDAYDGPLYEIFEPINQRLSTLMILEQSQVQASLNRTGTQLQTITYQLVSYSILGGVSLLVLLWVLMRKSLSVKEERHKAANVISMRPELTKHGVKHAAIGPEAGVSTFNSRFRVIAARHKNRAKLRSKQAESISSIL